MTKKKPIVIYRCGKCGVRHSQDWKEKKLLVLCDGCFCMTWHIREEENSKEKEKRNVIACYKYMGEWRLITRELSTLSHATKLVEKYSDSYKVKIIQLGEFLK